ncbi:hypothetical protein R84981_001139 [Carnimonas sp. R-84981]
MHVNYLGPLQMGLDSPALAGLSPDHFSPCAFAVEVRAGEGCTGSIIEGDVLIAEERSCALHDDLVIAREADAYVLMRAFRVGGRVRYLSMCGGEGVWGGPDRLLGVVVRQIRQY